MPFCSSCGIPIPVNKKQCLNCIDENNESFHQSQKQILINTTEDKTEILDFLFEINK